VEPERRFELLTCALRGRSRWSRSVPPDADRVHYVLVTMPRGKVFETQ